MQTISSRRWSGLAVTRREPAPPATPVLGKSVEWLVTPPTLPLGPVASRPLRSSTHWGEGEPCTQGLPLPVLEGDHNPHVPKEGFRKASPSALGQALECGTRKGLKKEGGQLLE